MIVASPSTCTHLPKKPSFMAQIETRGSLSMLRVFMAPARVEIEYPVVISDGVDDRRELGAAVSRGAWPARTGGFA